ncbi:Periplasmic trehalase [Escherichia coli]|nr:Periplasmic trehalase [Escherichia coli]
MVELLAQHEGDAALKQYLPQMQKNMLTGWTVLKTRKPDNRKTRCKTSGWYPSQPLLDDRDTPRPESWVEDIATAKSNPNRPATEIYRDLRLPLRLAGISARAGWTTRIN